MSVAAPTIRHDATRRRGRSSGAVGRIRHRTRGKIVVAALEFAPLLVSAALTSRNQEIFLLGLAALGCCNHPARHAPAAGPRIACFVPVLDGNFAARALATTAKELVDTKPVLLRKSENLLSHCSAFGVV